MTFDSLLSYLSAQIVWVISRAGFADCLQARSFFDLYARSYSFVMALAQAALTPDFLILGVIWYIVFLFSTTCHEGAHSLIAKLGGDSTAFHGGQVTLNPLPHIRREPFGLVVVPIIS